MGKQKPAGRKTTGGGVKAGKSAKEKEKKEAKVGPPPPACRVTSSLQSGRDMSRKKYVVPDWAGAVTPDFVERAVLGVVDYWLGLKSDGSDIRARKPFLVVADETPWYVVTANQLAKQLSTSVSRVRRAVGRLVERGFLLRKSHKVDGWTKAMRLRIEWVAVEAAAREAWGGLEPVGGDD